MLVTFGDQNLIAGDRSDALGHECAIYPSEWVHSWPSKKKAGKLDWSHRRISPRSLISSMSSEQVQSLKVDQICPKNWIFWRISSRKEGTNLGKRIWIQFWQLWWRNSSIISIHRRFGCPSLAWWPPPPDPLQIKHHPLSLSVVVVHIKWLNSMLNISSDHPNHFLVLEPKNIPSKLKWPKRLKGAKEGHMYRDIDNEPKIHFYVAQFPFLSK